GRKSNRALRTTRSTADEGRLSDATSFRRVGVDVQLLGAGPRVDRELVHAAVARDLHVKGRAGAVGEEAHVFDRVGLHQLAGDEDGGPALHGGEELHVEVAAGRRGRGGNGKL